jgi:hypothetical protein
MFRSATPTATGRRVSQGAAMSDEANDEPERSSGPEDAADEVRDGEPNEPEEDETEVDEPEAEELDSLSAAVVNEATFGQLVAHYESKNISTLSRQRKFSINTLRIRTAHLAPRRPRFRPRRRGICSS